MDFRWFEEFLECVATGDYAIAECQDIVVGFLPGDEGGDKKSAAGVLPCVEYGLNAFRRVFNDVEDETEIDHVGGLLLLIRRMDRVPAAGGVAKFFYRENIATVAAAVVEEGFAPAELAEFQQRLDGFGYFTANERGLVAVDFLLWCGRCRGGEGFSFNETMAFETKAFFSECAFPVQTESNP